MSSELRAVWPTLDGFGMACGCGGPHIFLTIVLADREGERLEPGADVKVAHQEFAVTCDTCQTTHWVTVTPDGPEPKP